MPDSKVAQAKDVEASLLGACLRPGEDALDAAYEMDEYLDTKDFFDPQHRRIAGAIFDLLEEGDNPDTITVTERLRSDDELDAAGGPMALTDLTSNAGMPTNAQRYALIIKQKKIKRILGRFGQKLITETSDDSVDALELLDKAQSGILEVGVSDSSGSGSTEKVAEQQIERHIESTRQRRSGQNPVRGVESGWDDIDGMTGGFEPQDYIVIAARPSMGKTAWAINCALNAIAEGKSVAIFSLEMSKSELIDRAAGCLARLNMQRIKQGYGTDQELKKMAKALKMIADMDLHILDQPDMTAGKFRAKARRMVRNKDVDMVIVDYLQLFQGDGDSNTREQEVASISRQMKITAKELEIPVVALSQLNRKPMNRGGGKRPKVSDLRESGAIEQDSDMIAFIHRVERATDLDEHDKLGIDPQGVTDFIIGKQRNGPVGTVYLEFEKDCGRFNSMNLEKDYGVSVDQEIIEGDGHLKGKTIPAWAHKLVSSDEDVDNEDVDTEDVDTTPAHVTAGDGAPSSGDGVPSKDLFDGEDGSTPNTGNSDADDSDIGMSPDEELPF